MELEYKLAAIIGSCVNENQLFTARQCILQASKKLTHDEFVFLTKLADHKEQALKEQLETFIDKVADFKANETPVIEPHESDGSPVITDFSNEDVTADNVAMVAETLTIK